MSDFHQSRIHITYHQDGRQALPRATQPNLIIRPLKQLEPRALPQIMTGLTRTLLSSIGLHYAPKPSWGKKPMAKAPDTVVAGACNQIFDLRRLQTLNTLPGVTAKF